MALYLIQIDLRSQKCGCFYCYFWGQKDEEIKKIQTDTVHVRGLSL